VPVIKTFLFEAKDNMTYRKALLAIFIKRLNYQKFPNQLGAKDQQCFSHKNFPELCTFDCCQ
jgi:hypothetical protein